MIVIQYLWNTKMMYLVKTPEIIKPLGKNLVWNVSTTEKVLFLTFDDGPIPEITPWVLNVLDQYNAQATFFCVGDNVKKHPDVFQQVLDAGHLVGNHTMHHLNGWKTKYYSYLKNTLECKNRVDSNLFRPPYGKITRQQSVCLRQRFQIIMWDVLSGDFDQSISPEKCFQNVVTHAEEGSIVVFHDSIKAFGNLKHALPQTLEHFAKKGFRFETLSPEYLQDVNKNYSSSIVTNTVE